MIRKITKSLSAVILIASSSLFALNASAQDIPPRENLVLAKQAVVRTQAHVQQLILIISSGGGGGGGDQCAQIRDYRTCVATRGCTWDRETQVCRDIHRSRDLDVNSNSAADPSVDENDFAANFALQGMGSALNNLGIKIDQAAAAWGTPAFFLPWNQACSSASSLVWANQAAKVSANLPPQGFVSANDFIPIDQELQSVRTLLFCP